jgi:hypothetical protein
MKAWRILHPYFDQRGFSRRESDGAGFSLARQKSGRTEWIDMFYRWPPAQDVVGGWVAVEFPAVQAILHKAKRLVGSQADYDRRTVFADFVDLRRRKEIPVWDWFFPQPYFRTSYIFLREPVGLTPREFRRLNDLVDGKCEEFFSKLDSLTAVDDYYNAKPRRDPRWRGASDRLARGVIAGKLCGRRNLPEILSIYSLKTSGFLDSDLAFKVIADWALDCRSEEACALQEFVAKAELMGDGADGGGVEKITN